MGRDSESVFRGTVSGNEVTQPVKARGPGPGLEKGTRAHREIILSSCHPTVDPNKLSTPQNRLKPATRRHHQHRGRFQRSRTGR